MKSYFLRSNRFLGVAFAFCIAAFVLVPITAPGVNAGGTSVNGRIGLSHPSAALGALTAPSSRLEQQSTATPIPIMSPVVYWLNPAPITYGTPLDGLQLNASVTYSGLIVPGFLTYTPPAGTVLPAGPNQNLVATFEPSVPNFSSAIGSVLITVNPALTTLSLTESSVPSGSAGPVTLTAVVSSTATGAGAPVGSVTFYDGSSTLGVSVPVVLGTARITVPSLSAGAHNFNASFAAVPNNLGYADFAPSSAAVTSATGAVATGQTAAQVILSATNSTSYIGQSVNYSARVAGVGPGTPTGTVTFFDLTGSSPRVMGLAQVDGSGYAHIVQAATSVGTLRVLAVYSGDGVFQGARSATLAQIVRTCTVSVHLVTKSLVVLDGLVRAQVSVNPPLSFGAGKARILIANAVITYCSNPGRSNAQAVVSGIIAGTNGKLKKGDPVTLTLRDIGALRSPEAVLVDFTAKQRLVVAGPYDAGYALRISTP